MFALLRPWFAPVQLTMDIRQVGAPTAMPTSAPVKGPAKAGGAAAPAAAPAPDAGAGAIKDKFSSNAPAKPVQQATLINPITVAKLSLASAKELPKELL